MSPCLSSGLARKGLHQPLLLTAPSELLTLPQVTFGPCWDKSRVLCWVPRTSHQPFCWLMVQGSQEPKRSQGQSSPHTVILPKGQGWLNSAVGTDLHNCAILLGQLYLRAWLWVGMMCRGRKHNSFVIDREVSGSPLT